MLDHKALGMLSIFIAITLSGCDGSVDIRGRVVDLDGRPVTDAQLTLGRDGDAVRFATTSDENGCFEIGGMVRPGVREYTLAVTASGFEPIQGVFPNSAEHLLQVQLATPDSSQAGSIQPLDLARFDACSPEIARGAPNPTR